MKIYGAHGLFLHASSVLVEGGALLFLGHSTAGKSTISKLLEKTNPILADDSVFASRNKHGFWQVADGRFYFEDGDICCCEAAVRRRSADGSSFRLLGCMRIHKAGHVKVTSLAPFETARYLIDAVMEVDVQRKFGRLDDKIGEIKTSVSLVRQLRRHWFYLAADIARSCPGWHLWFSKNLYFSDLHNAISAVSAQAREMHEN